MKKTTVEKELKCLICGNIQKIHRKASKDKPSGHRKGLWCFTCEKKTKHLELSEFHVEMERI